MPSVDKPVGGWSLALIENASGRGAARFPGIHPRFLYSFTTCGSGQMVSAAQM
jgi:hypothetical protein